MLNLKNEKKKELTREEYEQKIYSVIGDDLFKIFINSKNYLEFKVKMRKEKFKNPKKVWDVFYPKYEKYRQENLEKSK